MKPYYQDNHVTIYNKDCRDMSELPDNSVQCVVTSPPYWGLRKYSGEQDLIWGDNHCEHEWAGAGLISDVRKDEVLAGKSRTEERFYGGDETRKFNGQHQKHYQDNTCSLCGAWRGAFGLEPSPELYVQHTIEILREIRRVLRKDGVVFWNIGDSYFGGGNNKGGKSLDGTKQGTNVGATNLQDISDIRGKPSILKPKDLCLIPFRVAIAAQTDGWWVRSIIIWNKPNPMPESVKDRPTESHEYILMLTKSARYYWDQEAVREPLLPSSIERGYSAAYMAGPTKKMKVSPDDVRAKANWRTEETAYIPAGRNLRSVWSFPTQPYPEAHFAVFPEKLPELCIKAATPEVGCCSKCGAPWERITKKGHGPDESWHGSKFDDGKNLINHPTVGRREEAKTNTTYDGKSTAGRLAMLRQQSRENGGEYVNETKTVCWQPTCKCNADKVSSIVLDPFAGAGTTLWVAKTLNRKAVGYDLAAEYCELGLNRNRQQVMV